VIKFETGLFRLSLVLNRSLVLCSVLTLVSAEASGLKPYLKPDLMVTLNFALIKRISVSICNCFHAKRANSGKITILGGTPL